jgi:hypothetical protein
MRRNLSCFLFLLFSVWTCLLQMIKIRRSLTIYGLPSTTRMNTLTNNPLDGVVWAIRRVEGWQEGTVTHQEAGVG